ncbi:hypothetical protein P152DRAFT_482286 [Eremomyces bilateralis CBS 781.70]|uniref:GPI anchored protein n=1 Tax=Eremomyces bilateralis CBS 781.70 TaxID=1392243 RepID=A0A6G1G2K5_9PEZI|nr:uncharacterized protein P152DRAFT_482286 [Eremomyces bilateralis CBS 781.70]KAF1812248.1 hypothetical protein P152DRAFT_482286 [Eremomyces bilateralis CBS 781.70]
MDSNLEIPVGLADVPVSIGCKDCTTTGLLELRQGEFELGNFDLPDNETDSASLLESGSIELRLLGFGAHIELQGEIGANGAIPFTLFKYPVFGFNIPGLGVAGLTVAPELIVSWETELSLNFSFGFDVRAPYDSGVFIDLANLTNSSSVGLSDVTVDALPFTSNLTTGSDFSLQLSFKPKIDLGFQLLQNRIKAVLSLGLDLPAFNASFSSRSTAAFDASCAPLAAPRLLGTQTQTLDANDSANIPDLVAGIVGNMTHIAPSFESELELAFALGASIGVRQLPEFNTAVSLFDTAVPLPTRCLAFDTEVGALIAATSVAAKAEESIVASVSAAAVAAASKSASATGAARRQMMGVSGWHYFLIVIGVLCALG